MGWYACDGKSPTHQFTRSPNAKMPAVPSRAGVVKLADARDSKSSANCALAWRIEIRGLLVGYYEDHPTVDRPVRSCIFSALTGIYVFLQRALHVRVIVKLAGASFQSSGTTSNVALLPQTSHSIVFFFGTMLFT